MYSTNFDCPYYTYIGRIKLSAAAASLHTSTRLDLRKPCRLLGDYIEYNERSQFCTPFTLHAPPPPMKILQTQSAVLTNYEVLAHLTPQKRSNVNTALKEVRTPSLPLPLLLRLPNPIPIPIPTFITQGVTLTSSSSPTNTLLVAGPLSIVPLLVIASHMT